jgi:tetratricopeptide (TPR) repeat protein
MLTRGQRLGCCLLVGAAIGAWWPVGHAEAAAPEAYAVVAGIGQYRDKRLPGVPYAVADARSIADALVESAGLAKADVLLLTDAEATQDKLLRAVREWLPRRVSPNALVYVYYAGLGTVVPSSGEAALTPWDGNPEQAERLITVRALYDALSAAQVRLTLVLLDTCFAAGGSRCPSLRPNQARTGVGLPLDLVPDNGVIAFVASGGKEASLEFPRVKHGLFTHYLLNGLYGEADRDENGRLTLSELVQFTQEQVTETAWTQFFRVQTPALLQHRLVHGDGEDPVLFRIDRRTLARRHLTAARQLHESGEFETAIAEYRAALRLFPDDPISHLQLGLALRDKGDIDGAIGAYRMTLHLRPHDPDAHYLLGTAYSDKGQLDASIAEFRWAIRLKPGFDVAHNNLGHVLEQRGDLNGAIAEYRIAASLQPRDARAHYNLGSALKDKGDAEGAAKELREAIKLRPDYAKAYYHLGVVLSTLGRRSESLQALRKFTALNAPGANQQMMQDARARIRAME